MKQVFEMKVLTKFMELLHEILTRHCSEEQINSIVKDFELFQKLIREEE